jgi:SpoVK/Ycf46/Vps4 family AAA+-type ATPase
MADLTKNNFRIGVDTQLDGQLACINQSFENHILSHITGNYMNNSPFPLYLAIHGKKGEGKTFQTLRVCSKYRVVMYYISGAQLCGSYEKDSIGDIEENYNYALHKYNTEGEVSTFIIDDFHLSIASTEAGIGKTVNSQILIGFLMNLADKAKASKKLRIPFILLGNDFDNLYAPLTRDGRMDFYEWKPSMEEKVEIVKAHFDDIVQPKEAAKLEEFVKSYAEQPISFFTELKSDIYKHIVSENISKYISTYSCKNANEILRNLNSLQMGRVNIAMDKITKFARQRIAYSKRATHEERKGINA